MKRLLIAFAMVTTTATAQKVETRTCHEILGNGVAQTKLQCHELDDTTPGKYWYEKTPLAPGAKFSPEFTIMMRKKAKEQREAKKAQQQITQDQPSGK